MKECAICSARESQRKHLRLPVRGRLKESRCHLSRDAMFSSASVTQIHQNDPSVLDDIREGNYCYCQKEITNHVG